MAKEISLGIRITADGRVVVSESSKVVHALKGIETQSQRLVQSTDNMATKMTAMLGHYGAGLYALKQGLDAMTGTAHQVLQAASQADRFRLAMLTVTGSSSDASAAMAYVRETAQRLGVGLQGAAEGYVRLVAASSGTDLAGEKTRMVFQSVAQAGAALGLSAEEVNGALLAIGQMMSKGTVSAEELRGQLGERLPGAFQVAARAMGVTTSELGDMLQKGQVLASDFLPRFAQELDKTFSSSRFDSIENNINRIKNAWQSFLQTASQRFDLSGIVKGIADTADEISGEINQTTQFIQRQIDKAKADRAQAGNALTASIYNQRIEYWEKQYQRATDRMGSIANTGTGHGETARILQALDRTEARKKAQAQDAKFAKEMAGLRAQEIRQHGDVAAAIRVEVEARADLSAGEKELMIAQRLKIEAMKSGGGAGTQGDAYQLAKGGLDAQKAANRDLPQDQQETIRLSEAALKRQLDDGVISHQSYYTQLQTLREADLDAQIRAAEQEADIIRQAQANRPADRGKAGAESAKLDEDLAAKLREVARLQAAKQEAIADVQAEAAQADRGLNQQLDQLKLKLLELKNVGVPDILPADQAEEFQLRVKILREQYAKLIDELKAEGDEAGVALTERLINKEAWRQMGDEMSKFSEQAARNMQDAFANFLFDPFKQGTGDMLLNFSAMLRRLASESVASGVFDKLKGLFGGSQDSKGGLFDKLLGLFGSGGGDGGGGLMDFFMGIINGIGGSFDTGGYTGNAGTATPAGIVHGQEFVFSAPATKALGVGTLSLLHALAGGKTLQAPRIGYALGGLVNLPPGAPPAAAKPRPRRASPSSTASIPRWPANTWSRRAASR